MSKKGLRKVQDAAESNAGDDFHILWTIRKSLALLNFQPDGLKMLSLEGLTSKDTIFADHDGDICLGVDLTEYYGGHSFNSAKKVVISQLKYSTRHPNLEWTASRICAGKRGTRGSIIHRLGTFFKGVSDKVPEELILQKLTIKLVSNRPASRKLLNAITKTQLILRSNPTLTFAGLKKKLNEESFQEINKLRIASLLKGQQFTYFLKVLDFSDCNTNSRFEQKQNLIKAISQLGSIQAKNEYSQLHELISSKMMPEAKNNNTLTMLDILYKFGLSDLSDLFPASSRFELQKNTIDREQIPFLVDEIIKPQNSLIVLHGGAGIGKSTIVKQTSVLLPQGSVTIFFDCYGGGVYLDPEDKRHKHENAFLQLSNELAMNLGSSFLIAHQLNDDYYIKAFKKRLIEACEIIKKVYSDAIVTIIIDAADNSFTAARQYKHECFVSDLVLMSLPERCKIVITARTERLNSLNLAPNSFKEIELLGFSHDETLQFLKKSGFDVKAEKAEEFRVMTNKTPRVMSYALDIPGATLQQKLKPLKPNGKTLGDIFMLKVDEAQRRSGEKKLIQDFLIYIITLPRPIPVNYLQMMLGVSQATILDIWTDLWQGLIYENNNFSFRDEDFETFLRDGYKAGTIEFSIIADHFLEHANEDEYASTHLAFALTNALRKEDLLNIVLEQKFLDYPQDPIKNKEVFVERARRAMLHCTNVERLNLLKLQMVAAEAAKTNQILEDILLNNAELASSYGNLQTNQRFYFQEGNPEWFGSIHFRSAAIFSRNIETHSLAKEHLKKAENWLQYRHGLNEVEVEKYRITDYDIAYGAEAVLRLLNSSNCIKWLQRWTPKSSIYRATRILIQKLIETSDTSQIKRWFRGHSFRIDLRLLIVEIFYKHGLKPPVTINIGEPQITALSRVRRKLSSTFRGTLLSFCEFALMNKIPYKELEPLLNLIQVLPPQYVPGFYGQPSKELKEMDLLFRKSIIEAIYKGEVRTEEDFYPENLKKNLENIENKRRFEEREKKNEFHDYYKHVLAVYETRAAFILKMGTKSARKEILSRTFAAIKKDWDFPYRHRYNVHDFYRFLSVKLLDIVYYTSDRLIIERIRTGFLLKNESNIRVNLAIASRISSTRKFERTVLQILSITEKSIENASMSGSEKIDHFKEAAIIATRISKDSGKYYFDKMVLASSEVDIDAHQQIKCINYISNIDGGFRQPKLAFEFGRYVEYCSDLLSGWEHFPWNDAIKGLAKLDIASIFPILCRWDHRNVRGTQEHLVFILKEALQQNYINHITAGSFLPLNQYYWPYLNDLFESIFEGFDNANDYQNKNIFIQNVIQDIKLNGLHNMEFVEGFLKIIAEGKYLDEVVLNDFKAHCAMIGKIVGTKKKGKPEADKSSRNAYKNKYIKFYTEQTRDLDFTNSDQLQNLFNKLRAKSENRYVDESLVFTLLESKVLPNQRIAYLDAICDLSENSLSYDSYENILQRTIDKFNIYHEIGNWKKEAWRRVIKSRFSYFIRYDFFSSDSLDKVIILFDASRKEVANYLLSILPEYLDGLSASVIYQLFHFTVECIDRDERQILIEWLLLRWNKKLKPDFADGQFQDHLMPPTDPELVISRFVRYHLGHPDKRVRWRMAHGLRCFAKLGNKEIIEKLLIEQNEQTCHQFQNQQYTFFWISAKLYLWVAIDRICMESPNLVLKFAQSFLEELFDTRLPHAQIRFFIKSSCTKLLEYDGSFLSKAQQQKLTDSLNSRLAPKKGGNRFEEKAGRNKTSTTKFHFDSLDTLPYWYSPLGSLFGVSGEEVAIYADKYITKYWGYVGDPSEDNHVKNNEYYLRSNGHGAEPTVEDLYKYYEYHAMFCAANELLELYPLIKSDDQYEDWDKWITGWGLCWKNFWLADFRDPVPLNYKFWVNKRETEDWQWNINLLNFHNSIGLKNPIDESYLIIYESSTIYYGKDYESTFISSALVNPSKAPSLLRALQTSNRHDNYIPLQGEEIDYVDFYKDENELQGNAFSMTPWIKNLSSINEGIDDKDEQFFDISKNRIIMGDKFTEWIDLQFSQDYRFGYRKNQNDTKVTQLETWNTIPKEIGYSVFESRGSRLQIQRKTLLQFLKANDYCLILKCAIGRTDERQKEFRYSIDFDYTLFYLIYPNGKIETIRGNYQLR